MEVLCFTVVFTRDCQKLKGSTYITYELSDLIIWSKTTWHAISCKIWHSHSCTEIWNCVIGHVMTHVLKALQSSTSRTTCPVTPHPITADLKLVKSIHSPLHVQKKHVWNSPCSAFTSSDCRSTKCCVIFMVSFWISVGTNKPRVSSTKSHAWSILSMKVTQFLLQRIFPDSAVKHNNLSLFMCFLHSVCTEKNSREDFSYFLVP